MPQPFAGIACHTLAQVMGGNLLSPFGSPPLGMAADTARPLAASFDPLCFASPRVGGSSLGGDERPLRIQPLDRSASRRRPVRGTVSTGVVVSELGDESPAPVVVRRRA